MFVQTKASLMRGVTADECQTVTFSGRSTRKAESSRQVDKSEVNPRKRSKPKPDDVDMKKLRYEIIKFGSSGFEGELKEEANVALMVSLGAEPPKKKFKNYKDILLEKRQQTKKDDREAREKYKSLTQKRPVNPKVNSKKKKEVKGLLDVYGEVGKGIKHKKRRKGKHR